MATHEKNSFDLYFDMCSKIDAFSQQSRFVLLD